MEKRRGERIHFSQLVGSHTTFGLFSKRERYDNRMAKQVMNFLEHKHIVQKLYPLQLRIVFYNIPCFAFDGAIFLVYCVEDPFAANGFSFL